MISIVAAYARNRVIGRSGHMPWHIPGEQSRFKALTLGGAVILGRRSYEEIGKPLPDRLNIVLTTRPSYSANGCAIVRSLGEALSLAGSLDIFIAGGAEVYAQSLPLVDRLYLTEIDAAFEGDRFFPEFDPANYRRTVERVVSGAIPYRCLTYERI